MFFFRLSPILFLLFCLTIYSCSPSGNDSCTAHCVGSGCVRLNITGQRQQTDYTCGPASVLSLMRYRAAQDALNCSEREVAEAMRSDSVAGTSPEQMCEWLNRQGIQAAWHEDGTLDMLRENLAAGKPTLLLWSDWGGHWVLAVGYDTRNTADTVDDLIYFADSYDVYDGCEDGITVFNANRFDEMWYDAKHFGCMMQRVYIHIKP